MPRLRVGYVIGSLDLGGAEKQLLGVATRLDRARFDARIYCLSHAGVQAQAARDAGLTVTAFGVGRLPMARWIHWTRGLRRAFRESPPHLVHAFLFPSHLLAAIASFGSETAIVAGVRSVGVGREGRWPFSMLEAAGLKRAAAVVVNAQAVGESLSRRHPELDAAKVQVLPNGVDPSAFRVKDRVELRSRLGLPLDAPMVLMVANLLAYKGHTDALQALGRLRRRIPSAFLALAGVGPEEKRLRLVASALGLGEAVLFLGLRTDVPQLLAVADAVLLASREEGMPNAILEALAAGRPVVSTRTGGVPELLTQGVTGLVVEPGDIAAMADSLERVLTDSALAQRLCEAGPALIAEKFPWARTVEGHERLYASLVQPS